MHACPGSYNIGFVCVRVHVWLLVELGELWRLKCAGLVGWLGGWLGLAQGMLHLVDARVLARLVITLLEAALVAPK